MSLDTTLAAIDNELKHVKADLEKLAAGREVDHDAVTRLQERVGIAGYVWTTIVSLIGSGIVAYFVAHLK